MNPALLALTAEGFLARLSFGLISFALPLYAYRLGLDLTAIGFLLSLNLAIALGLKPLAGAAVDRFGLARSLKVAIEIRSLVSLLLALATVPWQLFTIRAFHGVSIAVRDPAVNALIAEYGGERTMASAFAWYQTAKSVAAALGKVLAGVMLTMTAANFTAVFALAFLLSALPVIFLTPYVPEVAASRSEAEVRPRAPAQGPRLLPYATLGFAISGTAYMLADLFPILAVEYAGLSEAQAGLIYALAAVAVLSGPVFGWLSDEVSRRLVLSLRAVANIASSLLYIAFPTFAGMALGRVLDECGKAAFRPAWGAVMAQVSSVDRRRRARAMGYLTAAEDAGEIAGPIVAGLLWSTFGVPVLLGARIVLALLTEVLTAAVVESSDSRVKATKKTLPPAAT